MATLSGIITPTNVLTASSTATLTNKTWNSNTIGVAYGGTGVTSPGTAGNVLTSNGTTWASTAPAAAGFTLGTPITTTSGTTAEFTGLPAGVKQVIVSFNGVSFAGTSQIVLQLSTSSAYKTSGYVSRGIYIETSLQTEIDGGGSYITVTANNTATYVYYGAISLYLVNSSTNLWAWSSVIGANIGGGSAAAVQGGSGALSGELNKLKIYSQTGQTFDAGSINIMYI